jgi:hypothetical protein
MLNDLKLKVGNQEDIETQLEKTSELLIEYTFNPDIMPNLKGTVSNDELRDINYFLFFIDEHW